MSEHCVALGACLACGGTSLRGYLDLGSMPLANAFHDNGGELPRYPLRVNVCTDCSHSQLSHAVSPDFMFRDYLYVSGTSRTLGEYFDWFLERVERDFGVDPAMPSREGRRLRVLDIGCNDGSLLRRFAGNGHAVWGVDPNRTRLAPDIDGVTALWGKRARIQLGKASELTRFDIIVAMNVLAHNADPLDFLENCREILAPGGRIYVQTSQADFLANAEFDCIYHEHVSYFTGNSLAILARRAGLKVYGRESVAIHGGSTLTVLSVDGSPLGLVAPPRDDWLGLYESMQARVEWCAAGWRSTLDRLVREGRRGVGYGAAAKAMTLLGLAGRGPINYVVDDNPLKQGLRTPVWNIAILPPAALADEEADLCVAILAWNFADEIIKRVRALRPGRDDVFVQPFPQLRIRR